MRFVAGTRTLSRNISVVAWFIIVRIGRMVIPLPRASRISTMNTERPSDRLATLSFEVVRASRSIKSECSARLVQILLAGDDVGIAVAAGDGAYRAGVGAAGRLRNAEGLHAKFASRDLRQIALLLRRAAVTQHCAHDVHLRVARATVATSPLDFLEDRGGRRQWHPGAAIFLRNQHCEVTGFRQLMNELGGIGHPLVESPPVLTREARAKLGHLGANVIVLSWINHSIFRF